MSDHVRTAYLFLIIAMLFGPAAIKQICLESLQRRASKIIVKSKCGTTSTDYLKLQSLEDRRNAHILGLVKRFLNNNVPQFLKNYFKLNKEVVSRETRRSNFVYLPAVRTETAKKSFYYNGSVVYNNYLVNKN